MNASQLIEYLKTLDPKMPVLFRNTDSLNDVENQHLWIEKFFPDQLGRWFFTADKKYSEVEPITCLVIG